MGEPFIGSEAVAMGLVTKSALRRHYTRLYRDVYIEPGIVLTAERKAHAAWLWSRRNAVVAGFSAAALHGSRWVNASRPAELLHDNRHRLPELRIWGDRLDDDERQLIAGVPVTTPARTALDLACWYPRGTAVAAIDALARAVDLKMADVDLLTERYRGRRGIGQAIATLSLIDSGAQSPKESWLRTVLVEAGLPRPTTQIPVYDDDCRPFAFLDMGWEDVMVAVEYDGEQHRIDRKQYTWDIRRQERIERCGWLVVRVVADDREADIIRRVRAARSRRT
ncbi:hypothetical protein ACN27E_21355 [Mycobacterium sp. WMMD1722]|uniref:hypothetical protein n=1 Tax=Mycobacterium sp. WMMD1722 TaxID=3404117 RepID=UPI003BF5F7C4